MKKKAGRLLGPALLSSSRIEAAVLEGGLQLLDRSPHFLGFNAAVVSRGQPFAVVEADALHELRQGVPLVGRKVEGDLGHPPSTRSTNEGSAYALPRGSASRRSRNAGRPSRSDRSSCLGGPRSPGSSSLMG